MRKFTADIPLSCFCLFYSLSPRFCPVCVFLWDVRRQHYSHSTRLTSLGYTPLRGHQTLALTLTLYPQTMSASAGFNWPVFMGQQGRLFSFQQFSFHPCRKQFLPHYHAFVLGCYESTLWPRGGFTVLRDG